MNQFAKSRIGDITLNNWTVTQFWDNDQDYYFNTSAIQTHFPVLEHKIGANMPLRIDLNFSDITVEFVADNADMRMNATMGFNVSYYDGEELKHAIYDENPIVSTMNAYLDQDFFYPALLEVKLAHDRMDASKTQPTQHTIEFSDSQYHSFQSSLGYSLVYMRSYINELFLKQGIEAPYYPYELYTQLHFYEGQAVIFLELEDRADEWFEDRFWDEAAREAAERNQEAGELPDFSFDDDRRHQREDEEETNQVDETGDDASFQVE